MIDLSLKELIRYRAIKSPSCPRKISSNRVVPADNTQDASRGRPRCHDAGSRRVGVPGYRNGGHHHVPAGAGGARCDGCQEVRHEGLGPAGDRPDDRRGPYGGGSHHWQQHESCKDPGSGRGGGYVSERVGLLGGSAHRRLLGRRYVQDGPEDQQGGRRGFVRLLRGPLGILKRDTRILLIPRRRTRSEVSPDVNKKTKMQYR